MHAYLVLILLLQPHVGFNACGSTVLQTLLPFLRIKVRVMHVYREQLWLYMLPHVHCQCSFCPSLG